MIEKEQLITLFEYIYSRVYSYPEYSLKLIKQQESCLEKFLKNDRVNKMTINDLWDFVVFSFFRYKDMKTSRKIDVRWIFGNKSIEEYSKRVNVATYKCSVWKQQMNFRNPLDEEYRLSLSDEYKEEQRNLFYGEIRGFVHCDEFDGILLDKNLPTCVNCRWFENCKRINKNN